MMTIEIEIGDEQLNTAVIKKLALELSHLKEDYENGLFTSDWDAERQEVKKIPMVVDEFAAEDRKKLKRLIKALERVLDWYGVTP